MSMINNSNNQSNQIKTSISYLIPTMFNKLSKLFSISKVKILGYVIFLLFFVMFARFTLCKIGYADVNPLVKDQYCSPSSFMPLPFM